MSCISEVWGSAAVSLHSNASSPGEEAVGGFIFDFERISGEIATRYICHTQVTVASITYQSLFLLYPTLSGMTGTAFSEAKELSDTYLPVWKSTSASGARWLRRAVRNEHHHAIEQASRRWRGGRRDDERTVNF